MNEIKRKLSLDQPAAYQIKVPGVLKKTWIQIDGEISITVDKDDDIPITTLTITLDQAGLHGFMRRLYSLGLPLISVNILEVP